MEKPLLALVIWLLLPAAGRCNDLARNRSAQVARLNNCVSVVTELAENGIITPSEEKNADAYYCRQATSVLGWQPDVAQLNELSKHLDKKQGFSTFLDTVIVLAGIGLIIHYFWEFLRSLPIATYEGAAYSATTGLLASGWLGVQHVWLIDVDAMWFVVPGALSFAACVLFTYWLHWVKPGKNKNRAEQKQRFFFLLPMDFPTVLAGLCAIAWGGLALFYHHVNAASGIPHFLAFISMIVLQSFFGFSIVCVP